MGQTQTKHIGILLIGWGGTGTTSILYRIYNGEFSELGNPTIGFNMEAINYKNALFNIYDLGGGDKLRDLCFHYFPYIKIFTLVLGDLVHNPTLEYEKRYLNLALTSEHLQDAHFLIICHKCDKENSIKPKDAIRLLNLDQVMQGRTSWSIMEVSSRTGQGIPQLLEWYYNSYCKLTGAEYIVKQDQPLPPPPSTT